MKREREKRRKKNIHCVLLLFFSLPYLYVDERGGQGRGLLFKRSIGRGRERSVRERRVMIESERERERKRERQKEMKKTKARDKWKRLRH